MIPSSEELEGFHDRVQSLDSDLAKFQSKEVTRATLVESLAVAAREWLRISSALKNGVDGLLPSLGIYDLAMSELLAASKVRSRATTYRSKLKPFRTSFLDEVVVAVMRFEGSGPQVVARQLQALLADSISDEEIDYVQEAARCSSLHCHRAAIILLWSAAIARMHRSIQLKGFDAFNASISITIQKKGQPYSRVSNGLRVTSLPELQRGRDFDLLVVGMDFWGYDLQAFEELDRLLGIRNSASHPGAFLPQSMDVKAFAEKLKRYVFLAIA